MLETFFIPTSDLQHVLEVILNALQGEEINYPLIYTGKEFVKSQHHFRDPPDSGAGSSGLTSNIVGHTDLVNTDCVLSKKIPECFVSVDPYLKKPINPSSTIFFLILSVLGF